MTPSETASHIPSPSIDPAYVSERIRHHLNAYLVEHEIPVAEDIHDDMSFDYIGLDSMARVSLVAAIDKEFQLSLDPTAAYDFVTVGALAKFVWSEITGTPIDLKTTLEVL